MLSSNEIIHTTLQEVEELGIFEYPALNQKVSPNEKWVKHVHCDGARFHVLWWNSLGKHCSEPNCIVNKSNV